MPDQHQEIADLPHARLVKYANEIALDQKCDPDGRPTWDDPTKLRFGAYDPGRPNFYLFALSGDVLQKDNPDAPRRLEKAFLGVKLDPDPTVEIYLQARADTTEDATMRRVFRLTPTGLELGVPILGTTAPASGTASRFYSDDRRYCFNVQGDEGGKIVQYATHGTTDESRWTAVGEFRAAPVP